MQAEDYLRTGDVDKALATLQDQVRKHPAEVKYRTFLFQLLVVQGQWDRALTQLSVAGEMDASTLAMVQTYREALSAEQLRKEVFAGKRQPLIFGQPERWIALMVEALHLSAQGKYAESQDLRSEAFELAPTTSGTINGEAFEWIADADPRLGPLLEVITAGRYYWIPLSRIKRIQLEEPEDLRDFVWMPAYFTWANGGETVGLIPARYPGSEEQADALLRLARRTEWSACPEELYIGLGQRELATDHGEYALLDVRTIELDVAEEAAEASAEDAPAS